MPAYAPELVAKQAEIDRLMLKLAEAEAELERRQAKIMRLTSPSSSIEVHSELDAVRLVVDDMERHQGQEPKRDLGLVDRLRLLSMRSTGRSQEGNAAMNLPLWSAIREYISAEIALHAAREQYGSGEHWRHKIAPLEEQSTLMETEVRRLIANQSAITPPKEKP